MPHKSSDNPLQISYSDHIPDLLRQLKCSLVISTYQAGKVIFLFAGKGDRLIQLPKHLRKPMGIAIEGDRMAIATLNQVIQFRNAPMLTANYPVTPNFYDALFLPRASYYCGHIDLHDLHWGQDGLWAVNTGFSCLCLINDQYSFQPVWQPPFISELMPQGRCHLNGMCMDKGKPAYVSALSQTDTHEGWRKDITRTGVVIHVPDNEIILEGLPMPHSPRLYDGQLYLLLSATGELMVYDLQNKTEQRVTLPGFVRGMATCGDYLFIGLSKIRETSKTFNQLPVKDKATYAGIVVLHKPTLSIIGEIRYHDTVHEIYDVQVLPGMIRPGLVCPDNNVHERSIHAPDLNFWRKEKKPDK